MQQPPKRNNKIAQKLSGDNFKAKSSTPSNKPGVATSPTPKPTKVIQKPKSKLAQAVENSKKNLQGQMGFNMSMEGMLFNANPFNKLDTASYIAAKTQGINAAFKTLKDNSSREMNRERAKLSSTTAKNSNSYYKKEHVNSKVARQEANYNKLYDKNSSWVDRFESRVNIAGEYLLDSASTWAMENVGYMLDLPEAMKTMKMPNMYDLKISYASAKEKLTYLDQAVDLSASSVRGWFQDKKTNDAEIKRKNETYNKKIQQYKNEKAKATQAANQAIQNGTYESDSENFYNSNIALGAINGLTKVANKVGTWIDDRIDPNSSSNWLSDEARAQREGNKEIWDQVTHNVDRKRIKKELDLESRVLAEKYDPNSSEYASAMYAKQQQIEAKYKRQSGWLNEEKFEADKSNPILKIFKADNYNSVRDILDFNTMIGDQVGQSLGFASSFALPTSALKGASMLSKATGAANIPKKVAGFTDLTSKLYRSPRVLKGLDRAKTMGTNFTMGVSTGYAESAMIGQDVYDKAVKDKLEKATGVSLEQYQKLYNPQDGETLSPSELASIKADYEKNVIEEFKNKNPKLFNDIIKESNKAADLAASTNMMVGTISNMMIFNTILPKGKYAAGTRSATSTLNKVIPFTAKPIFRSAPVKFITGQTKAAALEGLGEEAGINMLAQQKGEAYAEGKYFSIGDYIDTIGSKDWAENLIGGVFMSGPQSSITHLTSGALQQDHAEYVKYNKVYKDLKELSKYTGKDEIANFINLDIEGINSQVFSEKSRQYAEQKKVLQEKIKNSKFGSNDKLLAKEGLRDLEASFQQEKDRLLLTKINNAIHTGTVDKLVGALDKMASTEGISAEEKAQLEDAKDTILKVEAEYNKHFDLKDSNSIISNRFTKVYNEKKLRDLDQELSLAETKKSEAISRQAKLIAGEKATSKRGNAKKGIPKKGTFLYEQYASIFNETLEEVKNKVEEGDDFNEVDIKNYRELSNSKIDLEKALAQNDLEYQQLTSEEHQETFEDQQSYTREYSNILKTEDNTEKINKKVEALNKKYKSLDRNRKDSIRGNINDQFAQIKELQEILNQREKEKQLEEEQRKIQEEKEKVLEAERILREKRERALALEEEEAAKKALAERNKKKIENELTDDEVQELANRQIELAEKEDLTEEEENELEEISKKLAGKNIGREFSELDPPQEEPQDELDDDDWSDITTDPGEIAMYKLLGHTPNSIRNAPSAQASNVVGGLDEGGLSEGVYDEDLDNEDRSYSRKINPSDPTTKSKATQIVKNTLENAANILGKPVDQVSFEEYIDTLLDHMDAHKVEEYWNTIVLGYQLNKPSERVLFDKVYNKFFNTFASEFSEIDDLLGEDDGRGKPSYGPTSKMSPGKGIKLDANGNPVSQKVSPTTIQRINNGTANSRIENSSIYFVKNKVVNIIAGIFGIPEGMAKNAPVYEFNEIAWRGLDPSKIFDMNMFAKYDSNTVPVQFRVPDDILEGDYQFRPNGYSGEFVSFREYVTQNNIQEGSDEWNEIVPIVAYLEGVPAFFLSPSNMERVNMIQKEDFTPEEYKELLEENSRQNKLIRDKILKEGKLDTHVTIEHIDTINDGSASQHTPVKQIVGHKLGILDRSKEFIDMEGNPQHVNNVDLQYFQSNGDSLVVIIPQGFKNGKPNYTAFNPVKSQLNQGQALTIMGAIYSYMGSKLEKNKHLPKSIKDLQDKLFSSGINLKQHSHVQSFISTMSKTSSYQHGPGKTVGNKIDEIQESFAEFLNDESNKSPEGFVSMAYVHHKIVIAVKPGNGEKLSPSDIIVLDPFNITTEEEFQRVADLMSSKKVMQGLMLQGQMNLTPNFKFKDSPYYTLNESGTDVVKFDSYEDFVSENISLKASNVNFVTFTDENGERKSVNRKYAGIYIEALDKVDEQKSKEKKEKQQKIKVEKEKIKTEHPQVSEEELNEIAEKILKVEKAIGNFQAQGLEVPKAISDKLNELRREEAELKGEDPDRSFSLKPMTEEQAQEMLEKEKESFKDIAELSFFERTDLVNHIFHQIGSKIGYKKGSTMSKKKLLGDIKNKIFGIMDQTIAINNADFELFQELGIDTAEIERYKNLNDRYEKIKAQWETIEEDVLEQLEAQTGIKEVKTKLKNTSKEDQDKIQEKEREDPEEEDENTQDDTGQDEEDITARQKGFEDSSLEEKGKSTVSYHMKRFLMGINKKFKDKKGDKQVEKGFLHLDRYYDFRDIDNEIKVALNSPKEIASDYDTVLAKLKSPEIQEKYLWAEELVSRLEDPNTSDQTRIEFIYNYTSKHAISSKFVQFELGRSGFTVEVLDANFNDVVKNIIKDWRDNIKVNSILYQDNGEGEYVLDMDNVQRVLNKFENVRNNTETKKAIRMPMNFLFDYRKQILDLQSGEEILLDKNILDKSFVDSIFNSLKDRDGSIVTGYATIPNVGKFDVRFDYNGNIIMSKPDVDNNTIEGIHGLLEDLGLQLSYGSLEELTKHGVSIGRTKLGLEDLLDPTNFDSPISVIIKSLRDYKKVYDSLPEDKKRNELNTTYTLANKNVINLVSSNVMQAFGELEGRHTDRLISKNYRDNDKLISGLPPSKYATERLSDLTYIDPEGNADSPLRKSLRSTSFNRHSYLLDLFDMNDADVNKQIMLHHTAIGSLKEKGGKFLDSAKVTDLTPIDLEFYKLAVFFNLKGMEKPATNKIRGLSYNSEEIRLANTFLPTMSDKNQMMLLQSLAFTVNDFNYDKDGKLSDKILDLLYSQLVAPDMDRIASFHAKNPNGTNIKAYDNAAQLFNLIPSLNNLKDTNGNRIINLMKEDPSTYTAEYVNETYKDQIKAELNSFINTLVDKKLNTWKEFNIINKKGKISLDESVLSAREAGNNKTTLNRNLAAEFVINNLISNANMHMLFIGDPALYSQDKPFNSKNFNVKNGKVDVTDPKNDAIYKTWSKDILGVNLGKRLALMLAPGAKIFNSKNDTYLQVFMNDYVDISSNMLDLIETHYSKQERQAAEEDVKDLKNINKLLSADKLSSEQEISKEEIIEKYSEKYNQNIDSLEGVKKAIIDNLKNSFNNIADYLDIEATDAQEYTTVSEHIDILRRQGRIDDKTYNIILSKVARQKEDLKNKGKINPENILTKNEIQLVFQPIKPVYTGQVADESQDVMRTVYIKSSSFPLLPQETIGNQLNGLREALEEFEDKLSKENKRPTGVRASYQTANKVGSIKNAISPFKADGTFNKADFTLENIKQASLTLNRNDFRIQQDVPYKSDKNKEDRIKYGTQMLKVLFSNGVLDLTGFDNPDWNRYKENPNNVSEKISGEELFKEFNQAFIELTEIKKDILYNEMGVNKYKDAINTPEFKKNISDMLVREGLKRGYTKSEIDSFKLDEDGNFNMPLFMNNQSSKIESMLLSIITNRVISHKLPGYSYVAASEAGYKKIEDLTDVNGVERIIYTKNFDGELKGATYDSGEVKFAQVLLPSKFRDNHGNMIDLYAKKDGEYVYLIQDPETKRLTLNENMIQPHLLNLTSFRIPTSSHVSLSQIEIVGFLPPESGDKIVVPRNFTKQKGLDFDVDKENTYQLWTYINPQGRIKEFSKGWTKYLLGLTSEKLTGGINVYNLPQEEREKILNSSANIDINALKESDSDTYNKLLASIGTEEELNELFNNKELGTVGEKLKNLELKYQQKLVENKIVKIHSSVLSNPATQSRVTKVLSMDFAKSQAEGIVHLKDLREVNKFINQNTDQENTSEEVQQDFNEVDKYFSILDDDYQSVKMFLGSAGKSGIGVYSNYLTMASLLQQYKGDNVVRLREFVGDGMEDLVFTLGNLGEIKADLGRINTIDGDRTISALFEELQNTATDNEKEQIMGRTGINGYTISAFSIMGLLGIDKVNISTETLDKLNMDPKKYSKMSLGNLVFSTGIAESIVKKLEENASILTDYNPDRASDIIKDLKDNLIKNNEEFVKKNPNNFSLLTGDNLVNLVAGESLPNQAEIEYELLSFLEMIYSYEDTIRNAQKVLNISSKGLGLDFIESNNKFQVLKNMLGNKIIPGLDALILLPEEQLDKYQQKDDLIIPGLDKEIRLRVSSPIGASIFNAYDMVNRMYKDLFPYTKEPYNKALTYAVNQTGVIGNSGKRIAFDRKFAKEYKKYLLSNSSMFTGDSRSERERLFYDTENNMSLATYLDGLLRDVSNSEFSEARARQLLSNPLIRKFKFDLNFNKKNNVTLRNPSLIKYDDSNYVVDNKELLFRAIPELIEKNVPLPPYNGDTEYSTRKLAQDLVNYALLEGGVQEIIQFVKYVPISYLEVMGFTEQLRNRYFDLYGNLQFNSEGQIPGFLRQFFQNNADLVYVPKTIKGKTFAQYKESNNLSSAKIESIEMDKNEVTIPNTNGRIRDFIMFRDRKIRDKFILLERRPNTLIYDRLPVSNIFGMSEYEYNKSQSTPLKRVVDMPKPPKNENSTEFSSNLTGEALELSLMDNAKDMNDFLLNSAPQEIASVLDKFKSVVSKGLKVKFVDSNGKFNGSYDLVNNTIELDKSLLEQGTDVISQVFLKELTHALTKSYVRQYLHDNGNYIDESNPDSVPLDVRKLSVLYKNLYRFGKTQENSAGRTLEDFVKNFNIDKDAITQEEFDKFYGFYDIHEFMEMAFTSPEFREFLDKIQTDSGESFLVRFKNILKGLLSNVIGKKVSDETYKTIENIIFAGEGKYYGVGKGKSRIALEKAMGTIKNIIGNSNNKNNNPKVEIFKGFWTREDVKNNPDKVFLFGDNFEDARTGYVPSSTQAVIRGLPNAIGISTKRDRKKTEYKNLSSFRASTILGTGTALYKALLKYNNFLDYNKLKEAIDPLLEEEVKNLFKNTGFRNRKELEDYVDSGKYEKVLKSAEDKNASVWLDIETGKEPSTEFTEEEKNVHNIKLYLESYDRFTNTHKYLYDISRFKNTSFLNDLDFDTFKKHVDEQIAKAIASGKTIVLPADGIGTGKAQLEKRAPKLFTYLQQELNKLKSGNSDFSNSLQIKDIEEDPFKC